MDLQLVADRLDRLDRPARPDRPDQPDRTDHDVGQASGGQFGGTKRSRNDVRLTESTNPTLTRPDVGHNGCILQGEIGAL
jgi:hypothetical protein